MEIIFSNYIYIFFLNYGNYIIDQKLYLIIMYFLFVNYGNYIIIIDRIDRKCLQYIMRSN